MALITLSLIKEKVAQNEVQRKTNHIDDLKSILIFNISTHLGFQKGDIIKELEYDENGYPFISVENFKLFAMTGYRSVYAEWTIPNTNKKTTTFISSWNDLNIMVNKIQKYTSAPWYNKLRLRYNKNFCE